MTRTLDEYVLIFLKSGTLHIHEDGEPLVVRAGETLLLRPGHRHGGTSDEADGLTYFWLHFRVQAAGPDVAPRPGATPPGAT